MLTRAVIDLSHWNTVGDFYAVREAGVLGIIHKCTQGQANIDDTYAERRQGALEAGFLWGAYHFGDATDPEGQLTNFLSRAGVDGNTLYALDWEPNGGNTMTREQARVFLEGLAHETGRKGVVYSGSLAKEELGDSVDQFFGSHRLWLAHYNATPVWQKSWKTWWLHQYSDGQAGPSPRNCPGISGYCDTNNFNGDYLSADEWAGRGVPAPAPSQNMVEIALRITAPEGVPIAVKIDQS